MARIPEAASAVRVRDRKREHTGTQGLLSDGKEHHLPEVGASSCATCANGSTRTRKGEPPARGPQSIDVDVV